MKKPLTEGLQKGISKPTPTMKRPSVAPPPTAPKKK